MGCSPSRGNNFSGAQGSFRRGRTLLPGNQELQSDDGGGVASSVARETDGETWQRGSVERKSTDQRDTNPTPLGKKPILTEVTPEAVVSDKLGTQEITINLLSQGKDKQGDKQVAVEKRGAKKLKKSTKSIKQSKKKEKEKMAPVVEQKVDFPEPLVKAHQAAYAYLNPSITKYEVLLGLLDQTTQTQISLQPMVTFLALRYEEINRGLEEMVDEGEKLLKDNGEHLAWPCQMKNLSNPTSAKSGSFPNSTEPPPDLLQQLLQYTIQRMRLVGQSVSGIGDSALEEAVDYFSSFSEVMEEKLKAKRASEAQLMRLLTRIEAASVRKPGPDDSTLFSVDSGIGAESESLAGSERHRNRRESCESAGTNRTTPCSPRGSNSTPTRQDVSRRRLKMSSSTSLNSIDSTCTITAKEQRDTESLLGSASLDDGEGEEEEDEEEEEDYEEDRGEGNSRKRSNSSPPEPSQQEPRRLPSKRIENPKNVEMTLKMKDAISGRIRFVSSQCPSAKTKQTDSPKTSRRQWTEEEERSPKRPQTANPRSPKKKPSVSKHERSRSAESLRSKAEDPTLLELERTQKELSHRLERMSKVKAEGNLRGSATKQGQGQPLQATPPAASGHLHPLDKNLSKAEMTKCATGEKVEGMEVEEEKKKKDKKVGKGPLKATPPPSPPMPLRLHRGRNSVKRLIDTFSQGVEEKKQAPESANVLGPLRGVRKCGVLVLPGLPPAGALLINDNDRNSSRVDSERTEDLDLDNLPPPPLEVLMDNSFEGSQVSETEDGAPSRGRSPLPKRMTVSQRLRASMQSVTVLPSRGNLHQGSLSRSPARAPHQDASVAARGSSHHEAKSEADPESEEAASLYKQARKIIHLRHSIDSPTEKPNAERGSRKPSPTQTGAVVRQGGSSPTETVPSTPVASSQPPATPPVSRTRMLPSTPSTPSASHRRLPSPPTLKRQPTPPYLSSPPVIRKHPTPPPTSQRTLPSPPVTRQEATPSSISGSAYPFKAPSPPASPKVQRWSRENSSEDSSTARVFSNARSVFCPASPSLFEAQPCPVPRPPQAWASAGGCVAPRPWGDRGRLPMSVRGPQPFVRRSHSDRRPSLSHPPRVPTVSVAQTCGSEPAISTRGLEDCPTREDEAWDSQSDFRGASRSASHPDLCIVGQALQRE